MLWLIQICIFNTRKIIKSYPLLFHYFVNLGTNELANIKRLVRNIMMNGVGFPKIETEQVKYAKPSTC